MEEEVGAQLVSGLVMEDADGATGRLIPGNQLLINKRLVLRWARPQSHGNRSRGFIASRESYARHRLPCYLISPLSSWVPRAAAYYNSHHFHLPRMQDSAIFGSKPHLFTLVCRIPMFLIIVLKMIHAYITKSGSSFSFLIPKH